MKAMHKLCWVAGAVALGAAVAVPTWTSRQVSHELQAWASQTPQQGDIQLRNLQHKAGWLESTGTAELVMRSRCSEDAAEQAGLQVQVSYRVNHLPSLGGLNAFSWKATPQGEAAQAFKALFGTEDALSGQGHLTWSRQVRSEVSLPAISLAQGGGTVEASPSRGVLTAGGQRVAFALEVQDAQVRSDGFVARVQGMAFSMDLDNWHRGTGEVALKVRQLSTRDTTLEGLSLVSSTHEQAGKLDSVMRNHLDRLVAGKQELKNLAFDIGMKGMHAASVEKLTTLFSQSCGVHRMTQSERQTLRDALRSLLAQGMSLHVEQLKGESAQGAVSGELTFALQAAPPSGAISLAQLLTASGRIELKGDLASPELQQMATAAGWGRVEQSVLSSFFHYERGQLKVLDRGVDASGVQAMLTVADTVILALLDDRVPSVMAARDEPQDDALEDAAAADEPQLEDEFESEPDSADEDAPTLEEAQSGHDDVKGSV